MKFAHWLMIFNSIGQVLRVSDNTFVTFVVGNATAYARSMTNLSGSDYVGYSLPAGVTLEGCTACIFNQTGATPHSLSDELIGKLDFTWKNDTIYHYGTLSSEIAGLVNTIFSRAIESGYTFENCIKLCIAALAGKLSGAETNTITVRNINDTLNRITYNFDANNNRTTVTYDLS